MNNNHNNQSSSPYQQSVDFNQLMNTLASIAMLAFTMKVAKDATLEKKNPNTADADAKSDSGANINNPTSDTLIADHTTAPRPGWTIKKVLSAEIPLHSGIYAYQSSILDLYKTYDQLITQENQSRYTLHKTSRYSLKGMTLSSFKSLFKFAKYLELVRPVQVKMYGSTGKKIVKVGIYGLYELTDKGRADDKSWDDLCGVRRNRKK